MKYVNWLLLFVFCLNTACANNGSITSYNLSKPDKKLVLPGILNEVSGLTDIDSVTVACVQDENGVLFIYDLVKNQIKEQHNFHIDGDYEGIALVGRTMFVLRSDGTLFEISDYRSANFKLKSYATGIPANNNEGLCYDAENNRLLVACKSKLGKGPEFKDRRAIYGFDLKTKKLSAEPVYDFNVSAIKAFAEENEVKLPTRSKKNGQITEPFIKFFTSAIAIHPFTNKLYLLSAADHMLFIFDKKGNVEHIEVLDRSMFNKAEGITFFTNGDMLITNEAQDKKPTLLRFNYIKR